MFSKTQSLYIILCGIFITALVIADIIGGKFIVAGPFDLGPWHLGPFILSAGIIPFPLTFVLTDLINEFYGRKGARFITFLGLGMSLFATSLLYIARILPASENTPVSGEAFNAVFAMSNRMVLASMVAYTAGQLLDISVFHFLRRVTKEKMLWLRATGSTVFSQMIDSVMITFIALGGVLSTPELWQLATNNYGVKFLVAIGLTPLCYLGHSVLYRLLEKHELAALKEPHTKAEAPQEADSAMTTH